MSHICLIANRSGAVVAGDSLISHLSDPHLTLLRYVQGEKAQKCFAMKEKGLIWAYAGLFRLKGEEVLPLIQRYLNAPASVDENLRQLSAQLAPMTNRPVGEQQKKQPIVLLLAQRLEGTTTVWKHTIENGRWDTKKQQIADGDAVIFQAGSLTEQISRPNAAELRWLSFEDLKAAARLQVAKAISYDEQLQHERKNHRRSVGGNVCSYGLRRKA